METATLKQQRYTKYKPSNEEWLGDIPEHWEISKFKRIFFEKKKTTNVDLNCGSISYGKVVYKNDESVPVATKKSYQVVSKGDFLVNPLNLNYDLVSLRIALSEIDVVVSSGYIVLNTNLPINKSYYKWLLHIFDIAFMKTLGSGVRQTLSYTHIANCELVIPPLEEQTIIAQFLEDKTAKIEQAIAIKQKQIELLKERRQILIHKAVTKGLNENVQLKDSDVKWIGEIPEHWEISKLGLMLTPYSMKNYPNERLLSITRERGVIERDMENLDSNHNFIPEDLSGYKLLKKGDFGMNKMKAWQGSYGVSKFTGIVSPAYFTFSLVDTISPEFFHLAIRSQIYVPFFGQASDGVRIGQWDLSKERMKNIPFVIPSLKEQDEILNYIDATTIKTEVTISLKEKEIEKLNEYKISLVNSVVTGKVKVC
jgi:type I restriction enzyme S subunit